MKPPTVGPARRGGNAIAASITLFQQILPAAAAAQHRRQRFGAARLLHTMITNVSIEGHECFASLSMPSPAGRNYATMELSRLGAISLM
jgi:hypothetical protein